MLIEYIKILAAILLTIFTLYFGVTFFLIIRQILKDGI